MASVHLAGPYSRTAYGGPSNHLVIRLSTAAQAVHRWLDQVFSLRLVGEDRQGGRTANDILA